MSTLPDLESKAFETKIGSGVDLTSTLYKSLRRIAANKLSNQPGFQTLQPTALVHEAWLRLGGEQQKPWNDRGHFQAAVAETMRFVLIDRARRRKRIRHGGDWKRVDLDHWNWENLSSDESERHDETLLVIDEAIKELAYIDPQTARLITLHFFTGLTIAEAAKAVKISERTAQRRISFARAWLSKKVRSELAA